MRCLERGGRLYWKAIQGSGQGLDLQDGLSGEYSWGRVGASLWVRQMLGGPLHCQGLTPQWLGPGGEGPGLPGGTRASERPLLTVRSCFNSWTT